MGYSPKRIGKKKRGKLSRSSRGQRSSHSPEIGGRGGLMQAREDTRGWTVLGERLQKKGVIKK